MRLWYGATGEGACSQAWVLPQDLNGEEREQTPVYPLSSTNSLWIVYTHKQTHKQGLWREIKGETESDKKRDRDGERE